MFDELGVQFSVASEAGMIYSLPEGSGSLLMTPFPADSPVGARVARSLQYEVHEGGDGDEVIVVVPAFIAKCNQSFILQFRKES